MNKQIISITVTFNRVDELIKNIKSIERQNREVDEIIIVDNNSSDGTDVVVREMMEINKKIKYLKLKENTGGAGGFAAGVEFAMQSQFEYLWLMDDDGRPDNSCLEKLLNDKYKEKIRGPLIYSNDTDLHTELNIDGILTNQLVDAEKKEHLNLVHPFNGTLIAKEVFEKIGNINKNLFIWGDEQDFRLRWIAAGYTEVTLTEARYYHPKNRLKLKNKLKLFKIPDIAENRKYIYYRNQAYIDIKNRKKIIGILSILRWLGSIILFEDNKIKSLHGLINGCVGNLNAPHIR